MTKNYLIAIIVLFFFTSCDKEYNIVFTGSVLPDKKVIIADTILQDSITKKLFSRLTKPNSQGLTSQFILPEENIGKEVEIVFSGRARTNYAHSNAYINVATFSENKQFLSWNSLFLRYYFKDINTWCDFKDSIHFKLATGENPARIIHTFSYLGISTKENFDVDGLTVKIKVLK